MADVLVQHAVENVWCAPRQDLQVIFRPARISRPVGVRVSITPGWATITLPTTNDLYHVYQIGQIEPSMLGLVPGRRVWRRVSDVMGAERLIADIYFSNGLMLDRKLCWVVYTEERNLLLAVRDQPKIGDLSTQSVYMRLYSNAYFSSYRSHPDERVIEHHSNVVMDPAAMQAMLTQYQTMLQLSPGLTNMWHNGRWTNRLTMSQIHSGDHIELLYDSSVRQVVEIPLEGRSEFTSLLDSKPKLILRYNEAQSAGEQIDYQDDIDVYIVRQRQYGQQTGQKGYLYHKNDPGAFRQLTHRDYSIDAAYVDAYRLEDPEWATAPRSEFYIRLHIRNSGFKRPLVFENNRIQELYKLPPNKIEQAMNGTDGLVSVWRAEALENSGYTKLMRVYDEPLITRDAVEDAYGYNAVSRLMGNAPLPVETVMGRRQVSLPFAQWSESTMYEYDANGLLLGRRYHNSGPEYTPERVNTALVEGVVGRGMSNGGVNYGREELQIHPDYNYRFYETVYSAGVPDHSQWRDVTGDTTKYHIVDGRVVWLTDPAVHYHALKNDRVFLAYDFDLENINSLIQFSVTAQSDYGDGPMSDVLHIPVGKLDIWLNGHALIENLDYIVQWPRVVICNKRFLNETPTQHIEVRGTGFCNSDMTRPDPAEFGYVQYGMLSRNRRYNLRDDKVIRLVIGGATYHRSVLDYAENTSAIEVADVPEGTPYMIENIMVPIPKLINRDDYEFRNEAAAIDQEIEDYLTLHIPEPVFPEPVQIPDKYELYSPFISTILHDILAGRFSMDPFRGHYSDRTLKDSLEPYEYLLEFEPTRLNLDWRYVNVHPHNQKYEISTDIYQNRFIARAVRIYLEDRVDLASFLRVVPLL